MRADLMVERLAGYGRRAAAGLIRQWRATLLGMVLCGAALVVSTYPHFGLTWDEPEHVGAGMQLLDRGVYTYDIQHPPLARLAMALGPWLAGGHSYDELGPSGEQAGRRLFYGEGQYDRYLWLARAGLLPFYVLLLLATFSWARHSYGLSTGLLAVWLLITTPPLLGHAGIAALDLPGTATCIAALYCLLRWYEDSSWRWACWSGMSTGLAIASKLSAIPFLGVVGIAWLPLWWHARQHGSLSLGAALTRRLLQGSALLGIALALACFTYSWQWHYLVTDQHPYNPALSVLFGRSGAWHDLSHQIARVVPLPVGLERLSLSIEALLAHNHDGHLSYLLGQFSSTGFRQFYVVALLFKTPLPLLLLGLTGLLWLLYPADPRRFKVAAPTVAWVALLWFASAYSHINIGVRHVLVLYPLLGIAAAAFWVWAWRQASAHALPWLTQAVLLGLVSWQSSLVVSAHPDYLAYFNPLAGSHPETILIDSDLDWGQDVRRLQRRLTELKVTRFAFVYRGTADVLGEHLPGVWMAQPFTPTTGWVAASVFARDTVDQGRAFAWLKAYVPRERIGRSIDLYYIPAIPPNASGPSGP